MSENNQIQAAHKGIKMDNIAALKAEFRAVAFQLELEQLGELVAKTSHMVIATLRLQLADLKRRINTLIRRELRNRIKGL